MGPPALSKRLAGFRSFVLETVPPPARLLEVGCGRGTLALALLADGYDMTAVDPSAPEGAPFRRTRIEALEDDRLFDAVVASVSWRSCFLPVVMHITTGTPGSQPW